jgi:hypothetical protein
MADSLLKTFGALNPIDEKVNELVTIEHKKEEERKSQQSVKIEDDYNLTRKNLINLMNTAQEALEHALLVARDSEEPKAFVAVNEIMKTIGNINEQLLTLSEKKQKLDANKPSEASSTSIIDKQQNVTYNNVFTGSTNELAQMIRELKNKG